MRQGSDMMVRLIGLRLLPALALWAASVRADVINGAWCHTEQGRIVIPGSRIETVTGRRAQGDYTRHSFQYWHRTTTPTRAVPSP